MAKKPKDEAPRDLAPYMPWGGLSKEFDSIFEDFRRSFSELMMPFNSSLPLGRWDIDLRSPSIDLIDEGDHYTLTAELPGFNKDQVDVSVDEDRVTLRAERKDENEQKNKNYLRSERSYSAFQRSISLPEEVDTSKVDGGMKNGILRLTLPKKEPKAGQGHKIQLK